MQSYPSIKRFLIPHLMIIMAFSAFGQQSETSVKATDIGKFFELSTEAEKHRRTRLISIDQFNEMSKDGNTIILDSRSAEAYEMTHLKGAINLNFSDFTEEKLAKVIPNKKTRILGRVDKSIFDPSR